MTKVAILGFGTVGSGVAEVLSKNSQGIARRSGGEIQVKYILDVRDFPDSPFKDCFVKDFSIIENDPEVDVVVETIGGAKVALEFTTRALKAGTSLSVLSRHSPVQSVVIREIAGALPYLCFTNRKGECPSFL